MNCDYHPAVAADNHCPYCQKSFCLQCSDQFDLGRDVAVSSACFLCGGELETIGGNSHIEPFWNRLGEIYKYPLSTHGLSTTLCIALLSVFLQGFGLLMIAPFVALSLYSFACLRSTARGSNDAPGIEAAFEGSIVPVIYAVICMAVASFLAGKAYGVFGLGIGMLVSAVLVLVIPAMMILIAIEEHLMPALDPANLLGIIKQTGVSYFVMVLFIIVMFSSMGLLLNLFANTNFVSLSLFLFFLIAGYYNIIINHILGYLVYQHHDELGFSVSTANVVVKGKSRTPQQRLVAQMELMIKAGKFDAARDVARQILKSEPPIWEWQRVFKLFCAAKPANDVVKVFERYCSKLWADNETDKVADAYLLLKRALPDYEPGSEQKRLAIAEALQQIGSYMPSIKLIQSMPKESNNADNVGRALYLLGEGFMHLPNGDKHAEHYRTEHALHMARLARTGG